MKTNRTELVFILDRSGSMGGLEADTIGGYNSMLARQKREEGEAIVTTVLFDDGYELLHDRVNLQDVAPVTEDQYYVRGTTALLDALGKTIQRIAHVQKNMEPEMRADKVLFIITTDGFENASREYNYAQVKALVEREQKEHGWEFLFIGANIDAIAAAGQIGIHAGHAVQYHADRKGTACFYEDVSEAIRSVRSGGVLSAAWKARTECDFHSRKAER